MEMYSHSKWQHSNMKLTIDKMIQMSSMVSVVVVLEKVFEVLPNIQLTVVLLMAFIYFLTLTESLILVTVYTILDILLGGISLYAVPMFFAWNVFAVMVYFTKGKLNYLVVIGALFPIFYSITLGLPYIYMLQLDLVAYFIADIPFTLIFIGSNLVTIIWLYPMITRTLSTYMGERK